MPAVREHPRAIHDNDKPTQRKRYVAAGFAGFFLCDLLLTGLVAALVAALGCGLWRKYTRQPGESCDCF
jgi:hypothetical protein